MSTAKKPDEGCLSALSSCFKNRGQGQPEDDQAARPTSNVVTAVKSVPLTSRVPQQRASTPQSISAPVSQPGDTNTPPSAVIDGTPSSNSPESDHASFSTEHSKAPLDLWQEAYNSAAEHTQKWIDENVGEWPKNTNPFPELVELVRTSEEKLDEEAWQFEFHGRPVLLREYTNKVTTGLTIIGDIAINFAPAPSPIVWNALKVVLKANASQAEDRASIMGCTNLVLCLIRRGIVYEEVYLGDPSFSTSQNDLRDKLISVYKTCLEFLAFVHEQLGQGNMHRFLDELMEPGQGEQRVSAVKALEQELEFATRPCEALANRDRSSRHQELLRSLQLPLKRIDDTVTNVLSRLDEVARKDVMDYLSTIPVGIHHNEKCHSRTEGTCEWLLHHNKFREWEDSSSSSIFWLQGNMGTRKSYLSSKIIDRYLVREENRGELINQHDEGLGFFYCYRSDPSRRSIESILRSYIRQLSEVPRRPGRIHKASLDLQKSSKNIQHSLTVAKCKRTLIEIVNSYPRTTLLLDALDECTDEAKYELAQFFQDLVMNNKGMVKVFIASRKDTDIERYLQSPPGRQLLVCISTSDNADDIERFITHEISKFGGWKLISNDTKSRAKKKLAEKSNGMLDILPETLSAAYDEIYNSFQPGELERLVLQRTVRWVLYAKRPLETAALLAAIEHQRTTVNGSEDEYKPLSKSNLTQLTLESVCRDLVVRDPQLDTWGFSHASVAEHFLLKNEPWIKNAKAEITISLTHFLFKCCTAFGSVWPPPEVREEWDKIRSLEHSVTHWFQSQGVDLGEPRDPRHPLQTYTQQEWVKHMSDTSDKDPKLADVTRVLKLFLGQTGPQTSSTEYQVFCKYIMFGQNKQYVEVRKHVQPFQNSTFGIVTLGLTRLLPGWWDQALFPVKLNTRKESLLELAAEFGHASICEDLVLRGFPINRDRDFDDHGWNAFGLAMINGNLDIARFLLKNEASPYLPDSPESFKSLFCFAAEKGLEYLQVLLDGGADPNTHCSAICTWGCALSMAAWKGDVRSAEALINSGADANPKCSNCNHRSPLAMAFETEFPNRNSYLPLVSLLLKHGADANTPMTGEIGWKKYNSMLEATVIVNSQGVARMLVEHGADVKTPLESLGYDTILEYAVMKGDVDFARFLIEHDADVHSHLKIGKYGSLLAAATVEPDSSLDMVKFLIEEAHVDLEQLEWRLSPVALDTKSGEKSPLWSSLDHAMRGKYLTDVHQVDLQVLLDMEAYHG